MANTLLSAALNLLVSLTGFASGENYETTESILMNSLKQHYNSITAKDVSSIVDYDDVYAFGGNNKYTLITFDDGLSSLYDKNLRKIVRDFNTNPFEGNQYDFKLYSEGQFDFDFAYFDQECSSFKDLNGNNLNAIKITKYFKNQDKKAGNYYDDVEITAGAHEIRDSFYFKKLNKRHGENTGSICSIISTEILLGYYDSFYNDEIVAEEYDVPITSYKFKDDITIYDFSQSPGVDDYLNGVNTFRDYLYDLAKNEINVDSNNGGMTSLNQIKLVEKYLSKRNIAHHLNTCEGNFSDILSTRTKDLIKNAINANRPIISNGKGHSTVAFAYDDNYVWVHTGWGYTAATPWSTYEGNLFTNNTIGCIDIDEINELHKHSNNYFSARSDTYLCPCGYKWAI